MKTITAKPFVKWAGGKQGLATEIVAAFPPRYRRYFEPFVGGGSILLTAAPPCAVASDSNQWLIQTYLAIRDDWQSVAAILDRLPNTKSDFLRIRDESATTTDRWQRAAYFIYLNKTCFRGLYRVNQQNRFNVPYGAYDRRYYDSDNLEAVATALSDVTFCNGDFEFAVSDAGTGDFVYFDPPYYKLGGYSDFDRYTPEKFKESEHIRLASLCRELDRRGVHWLLSNSDTEFVRELYKGFSIRDIQGRRDINLHSTKRNVTELLIANY